MQNVTQVKNDKVTYTFGSQILTGVIWKDILYKRIQYILKQRTLLFGIRK